MSKARPTNKEIAIAEITTAAAALPEMLRKEDKLFTMTGAELKLLNKKRVAGKPIDSQTFYEVVLPHYRPVNHKDEMIKIYTSRVKEMGHEGALSMVADYITHVKNIHAGE